MEKNTRGSWGGHLPLPDLAGQRAVALGDLAAGRHHLKPVQGWISTHSPGWLYSWCNEEAQGDGLAYGAAA